MWHCELLNFESNQFIKVVPEILNNEQLVRLKEFCLKRNLVLIVEPVKDEKGD